MARSPRSAAMRANCPICDVEMREVERARSAPLFHGTSTHWTLLECIHCGAIGTSNLVLGYRNAIAQFGELERLVHAPEVP